MCVCTSTYGEGVETALFAHQIFPLPPFLNRKSILVVDASISEGAVNE